MKILGRKITLAGALPWILIIGGTIGLLASFILTLDHIKLLEQPTAKVSCDLNPIVSCGTVIKSGESEVFGFPNPFLGLAAFAVLVTTGVAILAGATLKRWYWIGLELGAAFGLGLIHRFFFQSVYNVGALCPYCMVVWVVVIPTFWYITLYNIAQKHIVFPAGWQGVATFARRHHLDILVLWLLVIAALILQHFWYYYGQYL